MSDNRNDFTAQMNAILQGLPQTPERPEATIGSAFKSGALDMAGSIAAGFGRSGFDVGKRLTDQSAALAPDTPDLIDTVRQGDYGKAGKAALMAGAASAPQLATTLAAGAAGLATGPFAPVAVPAFMLASQIPYWYGNNRLGQARAGAKYEDINNIRAGATAVGQSAADALVSVLFPEAKLVPGLGKTILGRIRKGALFGAIEEAPTEAAQEALSIFNENPDLKALLTPESLKRMQIAAEYGAAIGGPLGSAGQFVTETPSANRSPEDVASEMKARKYFTPASTRPGTDDDVRWMNPSEIIRLSGQKKIKAAKSLFFGKTPTLEVRDDGAGGVGVFNAEGLDIAQAAVDRGLSTVPVRIKGLKGAKYLSWDGQSINLGQEPYVAPGTGTAKRPVIASDTDSLEPARARAARGKKGFVKAMGMDIAIDVPRGGLRKGEADGRPWQSIAPVDYGHVKRGVDADGEPLDVYLGPQLQSPHAFVIEQVNPVTNSFDEHKAMLGFADEKSALEAYDKAFPDGSGPARRGQTVAMPMSKFKAWAETGNTSERISEANAAGRLPITVEDVHNLADSMGVAWDNDPGFMAAARDAVGTAHLDEMKEPQLRRLHDMLTKMKETGTPGQAMAMPIVQSWESEPATDLPGGHMQPKEDDARASLRRTDNNEYSQAVAYHNAASQALVDENGHDRMGKALGINEISKVLGPGWWADKSMPSTQQQIMAENSEYFRPGSIDLGGGLKFDAPRLTPTVKSLLGAYHAARGLALKQTGVAWNMAHSVEDPEHANGLDIDIGEPLSPKQMKAMMGKLKKAGLDEHVVPIPMAFGVRLFRPMSEVGGVFKIKDGEAFKPHDRDWAEKAGDVIDKHFKGPDIGYSFVDSDVLTNDWSKDNAGQKYIQAFGAAATTHARNELGRVLDDIGAVEKREAERRGLKYNQGFIDSIYNAAVGPRGRDQFPSRARAASIPLGGLDKGPVAQSEIYNLFGSTTASSGAAEGNLTNTTKDLKYYDLSPITRRPWLIDKLLDRFGFRTKYFSFEENPERGVRWQPPDLKRDGYHNGTIWVYDPRNDQGSFSDPEYTNAWRVPHELGHALTEDLVQRRYGDGHREGRLGRAGVSYRGAPGKQVEIETRPLTLKEAQRALEWEDVTFRAQRQLLDSIGVPIDDAAFNREYNTNLADATYRILFGDFGDPGKRGFIPSEQPADLKAALQLLDDAEKKLAAEQGRPPTKGVDLDKWRQFRDDEIAGKINQGQRNRKKGRANQSDRIGLPGDSRFDAPAELLPGFFSPLQAFMLKSQVDIASPSEWKNLLMLPAETRTVAIRDAKNKPTGETKTVTTPARPAEGIKQAELDWSGVLDWLDAQDPKAKLTKSDVMALLKDKEPQVQDTYFGAPPGRGDGTESAVDHPTPAGGDADESEPDLPEFDEHNHDDVREATRGERRDYVDNRIDQELDDMWENIDSEELRSLANQKADEDVGAQVIEEMIRDGDEIEYASIKDAAGLEELANDVAPELGLGHVMDNINKQLELPGIERDDEQKLNYAKEALTQAATDLFKKHIDDYDRATQWKAGAGIGAKQNTGESNAWKTLAKKYGRFMKADNAAALLEEPSDMRDAFDDSNRDYAAERLGDSFDEDWADMGGNRIWKSRVNATDYEIKEDGDGGFDLYIDDDESGSYRSFNAARDAAIGHAQDPDNFEANTRSGTPKQIERQPAESDLPPQSVYGGRARWASRSLPGIKNYREVVTQVKNLPGPYSHGHWSGVTNPAFHTREGDLDIPGHGRTNVALELQSDLGSESAKSGTFSDMKKLNEKREGLRAQRARLNNEDEKLGQKTRAIMQDTARQAIYKNADVATLIKVMSQDKTPESWAQIAENMFKDGDSGGGGDAPGVTVRDIYSNVQNVISKMQNLPAHQVRSYAADIGNAVITRLHNYLRASREHSHPEILAINNAAHDAKQGGTAETIGFSLINDPNFGKMRPKYDKLMTRRAKISAELQDISEESTPAPAMPWGDKWFEFAIKKFARFSAERGYDSIAIPTSPVTSQIEQWGLTPAKMYDAMSMSKEDADAAIANWKNGGVEKVSRDQYERAMTKKSIGAIANRQDVTAPRILRELGKPFGVKPVMVDKNSGKEIKPVKVMMTLSERANQTGGTDDGRSVALGIEQKNKLFEKHGVTPFEIEVLETGNGQVGGLVTKEAYGNGLWILPLTDEMRKAFKKPQPGYRHGGLVRSAA